MSLFHFSVNEFLGNGDPLSHGGDQYEKKNMSFHSRSRSEFHFELSMIYHFQNPTDRLSVAVPMLFVGGMFCIGDVIDRRDGIYCILNTGKVTICATRSVHQYKEFIAIHLDGPFFLLLHEMKLEGTKNIRNNM